jgi:site-specific DNA-methyltransferase (adenine-specific)
MGREFKQDHGALARVEGGLMVVEREVTIGDIRLIQGDMRAVLPDLDPRADMVLSDVPYRLTSGGNSTGEMGGCFDNDKYDNSGALFGMVEWQEMAPLIFDACADPADAIIMTSDREAMDARQAFQSAGFGFHRLLVWDKITATPNRWYMPNCEFALYLFRGGARRIRDCGSKALIRCPQVDVSQHFLDPSLPADDRKPHATEKPVQLMLHWMGNSTDPGDTVLDPFMGAGATMVAAALSGRHATGIEIDPRWFEVTCARVRDAVDRPRPLFDNTAAIGPVQEAMVI